MNPSELFLLTSRSEKQEHILGEYSSDETKFVRLNMIMSINGSIVGSDGTSHSLSNPNDRMVLGAIRRHADVVVVGAESVRVEGYLTPKNTPLAVVTRSGLLTGNRFDDGEKEKIFLVCSSTDREKVIKNSGFPEKNVLSHSHDTQDGQLSMAQVLSVLAEKGFERVVCEGGSSLASQFISEDLIDELCLTISPQIVSHSKTFLTAELTKRSDFTLTRCLSDSESYLFTTWTRSK